MTDTQIMLMVVGGIVAVLLVFIAIILIRTAAFKPKKEEPRDNSLVDLDEQKIVTDFQEMIRCKTISYNRKELEDDEEFEKFHRLLVERFPNVNKVCSLEKINDRAILYKWKGKSSDKPSVLMSHYDVVSVEESEWAQPPFCGDVIDGVLWGRGALDTKATLSGVIQACEKLIGEGFVPENDVYMAFAGDEEINGNGAPAIVEYFRQKGVRPELVVDEGGAVVEKVFPGVTRPCALIGIAEKGMLNLEFSALSGGGHASAPPAHTLVGKLSQVCVDVENKPFKYKMTPAAQKMFDTLGRHSSFLYRMIFANLWLFSPILNLWAKKSGGEINALVRTTCAFTQMEGSKGMNVMPATAKMVANYRIISGETVESVTEQIRKIVDDRVQVNVISGINPSVVSSTDCEGWDKVSRAVANTWTDAIVSPYLMVACSDSRHYGAITDKVYRFSAMRLSKEERASIHGNDEKIPVETLVKTVEFYVRLIKTL